MKIYVKKSKLEGTGLFALNDIKKGEKVAVINGPIIKWNVVDQKTSSYGPNWIGYGKNKWIETQRPFIYFNHSCEPNTGIKGSRTIIALKNIKKDEEVTFDYSITEEDLLWKLDKKCRCNTKTCRGIIKSIQYLPKRIFNKYLPNIPTYFQKIYIGYNKKHG